MCVIVMAREESAAKGEFVNEDLPYYISRIYLKGSNMQDDPWLILEDAEHSFRLRDNSELIANFAVSSTMPYHE